MLIQRLAVLLPLMAAANAFKNSSPFLMLSEQALNKVMQPTEVQRAEKVESAIVDFYTAKDACKAGRHVLISQPGLTTADLQSLPQLAALAKSSKLPGRLTVPNVIGEIDTKVLRRSMESACGRAWDVTEKTSRSQAQKDSRLTMWSGKVLPEGAKDRVEALRALDARLDLILGAHPSSGPNVIVLVSKPLETVQRYEMDEPYQGVLHQELKRSSELSARANGSSSNRTSDKLQDGLPLFEKYAYFSPALFMGLSVSVLLLIILYVGVSAIAGLEVSYMAFSKEMAPQNQKKQQ